MDQDAVGLSELIGTIFFVSGLMTILQSTFGVRLVLAISHIACFSLWSVGWFFLV